MIASPLAGKVLGNDRGQFVMAEWQDPGGVPGQKRLTRSNASAPL